MAPEPQSRNGDRTSERADDAGSGAPTRSGGDRPTWGRRGFLRTATVAAVGTVGLGAATGTAAAGDLVDGEGDKAAAPEDFPRVSTRDHFDDDGDIVGSETPWSYDVEGSWPGSWGEDTLTLLIHGWLSSDEEDEDIDSGYECKLALEKHGYDGDTAVFTWDSDTGDSLDYGWSDGKEIAEKNGRKLANFTQWYANEYGVNVRWIAHSLGARVAMYGMKSIHEDYGDYELLESVSLLGGAVDDETPSIDSGWWDSGMGGHVEFATRQCDNFHNYDDEVLEWIYETREWDDAVGEVGLDGEEPDNYTDYDVTDVVPTHYDYYVREYGCVPQVVANW